MIYSTGTPGSFTGYEPNARDPALVDLIPSSTEADPPFVSGSVPLVASTASTRATSLADARLDALLVVTRAAAMAVPATPPEPRSGSAPRSASARSSSTGRSVVDELALARSADLILWPAGGRRPGEHPLSGRPSLLYPEVRAEDAGEPWSRLALDGATGQPCLALEGVAGPRPVLEGAAPARGADARPWPAVEPMFGPPATPLRHAVLLPVRHACGDGLVADRHDGTECR